MPRPLLTKKKRKKKIAQRTLSRLYCCGLVCQIKQFERLAVGAKKWHFYVKCIHYLLSEFCFLFIYFIDRSLAVGNVLQAVL